MKGGEKITSEWDRLMDLPKEDLVIELVKARRDLRNLCSILAELSENGGSAFMYDEGSEPSEAWLNRIARYATVGLGPGEKLCGADLEAYGISEDAADGYIEALHDREDH